MTTIEQTAEKVGRQHGTAFYFSREDSCSYLDHMEAYCGRLFEDYLRGFLAGLDGKHITEYDYMRYQ